jgi:CheY-like chemotaxis protein
MARWIRTLKGKLHLTKDCHSHIIDPMALLRDIRILLGTNKKEPKLLSSSKKILIVEDEIILRGMYCDKFTVEGFDVVTAENGDEGLRKAVHHKPDIVLLDLMMPVMDGKAMLRKLRAIPEFKRLPVIILTNAGDIENIKETQHYENAVEFLIKSNIAIDEIVTKVKIWM